MRSQSPSAVMSCVWACAELGRTRDECRAESRPLGKREMAIAGRRVRGIVHPLTLGRALESRVEHAGGHDG
jgi:hypothetical protein